MLKFEIDRLRCAGFRHPVPSLIIRQKRINITPRKPVLIKYCYIPVGKARKVIPLSHFYPNLTHIRFFLLCLEPF